MYNQLLFIGGSVQPRWAQLTVVHVSTAVRDFTSLHAEVFEVLHNRQMVLQE